MNKLTLKNRRNQNIVGILTKPESEIIGTAVLQHGYGGKKEHVQIIAIQEALLKNGFQVFNFDSPNSFGESDGEYKNARQGLHANDFEDVVNWTQEQDWFIGKLLVSGHSMGGFASARYTLRNPDVVDFAIPFAPVISGELIWAGRRIFEPESFKQWKKEGIQVQNSISTPGAVKEKPFEVMYEYLNHSLLKEPNETKPMLLIGCEYDTSIPLEFIKIFYKTLEGDKEFKIINGAKHTPREPEQLEELKNIINTWLIKKLAEY